MKSTTCLKSQFFKIVSQMLSGFKFHFILGVNQVHFRWPLITFDGLRWHLVSNSLTWATRGKQRPSNTINDNQRSVGAMHGHWLDLTDQLYIDNDHYLISVFKPINKVTRDYKLQYQTDHSMTSMNPGWSHSPMSDGAIESHAYQFCLSGIVPAKTFYFNHQPRTKVT